MHFKVFRGPICVAEYEADQPKPAYEIDPAYSGEEYITRDEAGNVVALPPRRITFSKLDFLRRFTPQERVAIRTAAKSDPIVEDFMDLLDAAQTVDTQDPETQAGLQYLVASELITSERSQQIQGE